VTEKENVIYIYMHAAQILMYGMLFGCCPFADQ